MKNGLYEDNEDDTAFITEGWHLVWWSRAEGSDSLNPRSLLGEELDGYSTKVLKLYLPEEYLT